jgi:hypothetical protein
VFSFTPPSSASQFPAFIVLVLPFFPLPYLYTSRSFCSTRGRSGCSGVKKGLLCPGNRTWVNQPVARSLYRLLHIYTILTYKEFVILLLRFTIHVYNVLAVSIYRRLPNQRLTN